MELGAIGVCRVLNSDNAQGSVNGLSSARCHIRKCGYSGHDA